MVRSIRVPPWSLGAEGIAVDVDVDKAALVLARRDDATMEPGGTGRAQNRDER